MFNTGTARYDMAEWTHEFLEEEINDFYKDLKDDEQPSVSIVLNGGHLIFPTWLGYQNPNFIIVEGVDTQNREIRALVSHEQVQLIMTVIKHEPESEYPKIGFQARIGDAEDA
tara:strand:+ start:1661 stop:1999 length:339 start_codon:yes stop_codon:yes gene_type:complete